MIFVTTGTQEPFDRLVHTIDEIAETVNEDFVVQAFAVRCNVKNIQLVDFLGPKQFEDLFQEAKLIISHAGMGTIITALTTNKPIIVMPRKASLGEHRNEHQLATSNKLKKLGYIYVADNEIELKAMVKKLLNEEKIKTLKTIGEYASPSLLSSINSFLQ